MRWFQSVWAWGDCPFGWVNDPYPGLCARYLDTNNDQICDLSQASPTSFSPVANQPVASSLPALRIWLLLAVPAGLYFIHWYLATKTSWGAKYWWLNQRSRRYFWNVVLLLTFLPTGLTGLLLALGVVNRPLSDWHLWLGIICTVVGLLHCWERLSYFLTYLPKPR